MIPVYVALLAPAVAALVGALGGLASKRLVVPVAVGGAAVAFLATVVLTFRATVDAPLYARAQLAEFATGGPTFGLDLRADGVAALVSLAVTTVALAVQVYSTGYLKSDPRYSSYAGFVSLFTAAMLLVVFADDLLVLLVGWEVMGICSYFLIGHHWEAEGSRAAAVKALIVTRLGDIGFLFGLFALASAVGTFSISEVVQSAAVANGRVDLPNALVANPWLEHSATVATLLILCGVVGKSAQFPLHTWLPDAMAGPTPISALIHAATMVAAGIYVVVRLFDVFLLSGTTLAVMAVIASVSMLGGALAALAQSDIKRVLAYSTVSQLAYMLAALSVGSAVAAQFHLLTHAAFKALLFLAAGSVLTAVGSNLMSDMGGLRRAMPVTFVTMTVGLAALVGIPPFSGFFSKEAVIGAAEETALGGDGPAYAWTGWLVLVVGLVTVAVTAAYAMRLWLLTFFGPRRTERVVTEPARTMTWPLVVLAVPALALGAIGLKDTWLPRWLGTDGLVRLAGGPTEPGYVSLTDVSRGALVGGQGEVQLGRLTSTVSVAMVLLGVLLMWRAWRRAASLGVDRDPVTPWRWRPAMAQAFYVDDVYEAVVVRPVMAAARGVAVTDDRVVDAAAAGAGTGATGLAGLLARTQQGNVQAYLTGLLAGVLLLVLGVVTFT